MKPAIAARYFFFESGVFRRCCLIKKQYSIVSFVSYWLKTAGKDRKCICLWTEAISADLYHVTSFKTT